ncbi:hypothetical protein CKAH01_18824 [Colletotrichum kahawae]|uniref:FAD-dependent oxidoreductase 2 FAD-binding domain-containing protein n=1 Tax=Colletotrichum kahawae TaxID=34407 RepID=A0AAD9Y665_COLKA|nr:hypothetical protein CKAH01_18824 [Colletotrichum kahawae]
MTAKTVDVLVVGSGAAGLAAAATAMRLQLSTLLIEQTDKIGGMTAYSSGTVWIPRNKVAQDDRCADRIKDAQEYLEGSLDKSGRRRSESSPERVDALLTQGPKMVKKGAQAAGGRMLDPAPFDAATLKAGRGDLRAAAHMVPAAYFHDFHAFSQLQASAWDFVHVQWLRLWAWARSRVMAEPTYMGCSLVAQLLAICKNSPEIGFKLELNTALKELKRESSAVPVAVVESKGGERSEIHARFGVVLATGGFARCETLRKEHLPHVGTEWTLTQPQGDTGDAMRAAGDAGAVTSLLSEAWWIPTMIDPGSGQITIALFELGKPHCIVVDRQGRQVFAEADPYSESGRALYKLCEESRDAWLVVDAAYRARYALGTLTPGTDPSEAVASSRIHRADTVKRLAGQIKAAELTTTVDRWNEACERGVDGQFGKGNGAYHRFVGDARAKRPNLGTIAQPPFYAVALRPGDAGTRGGLRTDHNAQVLDMDRKLIKGLYAAGNASALVMGATSLGAGVTLGPAMTFAYIAAYHMWTTSEPRRGGRGAAAA